MSSRPGLTAPRFLLACVATVCALALAASWWHGSGSPPAIAPEEPTAPESAVAPAFPAAVDAEVSRDPVAPPRTAVTGIVLGDDRRPLTRLPVWLQKQGRLLSPRSSLRVLEPKQWTDHPLRQGRTDDHGEFTFEELEPGTYSLRAGTDPTVSEQVEVASGEVRHCELQFTRPIVLLWGRLHRADRPAPHATIRGLRDGKDFAFHVQTDERGDYRVFVVPGSYSLLVMSGNERSDRSAVASMQHDVVLPDTIREYRCDLHVPGTLIQASVAMETPGAVGKVEFVAEGRDRDGNPVRIARTSPDGRPVGFADLPYGEWTISARSPELTIGEPQRVELTSGTPMAQVALPAAAAGIVRLHLRDAHGRPQTLPAAALPRLHAAGGLEIAAVDLGNALLGAASRGECGYVGVPPGAAELRLEDRDADGRLAFLPFDPLPAQELQVMIGDRNRIDLQIERRSYVQVRAFKPSGGEDATAEVRVQAGDRAIHGLETERRSRWHGHLPPGEYVARVRRGDRDTERRFVVNRSNLELTLRP